MIKITANYSFWKHPIKWLSDRKKRKMLEWLINNKFVEDGWKDKVDKAIYELAVNGSTNFEGKIIKLK